MNRLLLFLFCLYLATSCGKSGVSVGEISNLKSTNDNVSANSTPVAVNDTYDLRPGESVSFNILSNDSDSDGTFSVTSIDSPRSGSLIDNGNGNYTYIADASFHGQVSLNYTITDNQSAQANALIKFNVLYATEYTGREKDGDWNNPKNWCGTITDDTCDGASFAPITTDVVYFSGVCELECNVSLDTSSQAQTYLGLKMASDYTGTITLQGSNDFTLKDEGFLQEGGILNASGLTGTFLISDYIYTKIGMEIKGGNFTAGINTEISISILGSNASTLIKIDDANYFDHNNGHFKIEYKNAWAQAPSITYNLADQTTFYNLELNAGGADSNKPQSSITTASKIVVENDFTFNLPTLTEGNIDLYGDLYLGSRPVNYSYQSGSSSKAMITFKGNNHSQYECLYTSSINVGPPISIDKGSYSVAPSAGTTNCGFSGINILSGTFIAPSETLNIAPYIPYDNYDFYLLNTSSGTTFNHNGGHLYLQLMGGWMVDPNAKLNISETGITLNDLTIVNSMNSSYKQEIVADLGSGMITVEGNLTIDQTYLTYLSLPTVEVQGDVSITGNQSRNFDLILNGSNQSFSNSSTLSTVTGNLTFASSGTISVLTDLNMSTDNSDILISSGVVNILGNDLLVDDKLTIESGATLDMGGGVISYGTILNSGTFIP
ncbi:MAG: Ig-like domain-containing protein [Halobacteriovoraceae bacterium]|nr:Ig-like domain-containing protein [Halobacteriovoraceae bacterium]